LTDFLHAEPSSGDSQSHAVIVDIPSLAKSLEQELTRHRRLLGGSTPCTPTIGMVGKLTRNVDPQEYDPHHVSIGPYHRKRSPNVGRYNDKLASLDAILAAATPGSKTKTVEVYLAELATDEDRARSYYANTFDDMTSCEFLRMLLLDACFLLNWLVKGGGNQQEIDAVLRDVLFLVENQIPYFVVDKVHKLTSSGAADIIVVPAWETMAGHLSQRILQKQQYTMATIKPPAAEPGNLLDLVHMHFLEPTTTRAISVTSSPTGQQQPVGRWRTAMEYHISGVNLKGRPVGAGSTEASSILDVKLDSGSGGTLVVPRLRIDADTGRILRNLVALEQQNPDVGSHVTAYCIFMSQIACTASDVELLSRRGVIVHLLGNHGEVATFFSDLCKGVLFDPDDADRNYLRATCQELDKWYRSRRRRWIALLWHKYLANPWLAIGVMAAALGLISTLVQTLYTALSYYRSAQ